MAPEAPASIKYENDRDEELKRASSMCLSTGGAGVAVQSDEQVLREQGGEDVDEAAAEAAAAALAQRITRDVKDAEKEAITSARSSSSSSDEESVYGMADAGSPGTPPPSSPDRVLDLASLAATFSSFGAGSRPSGGPARLTSVDL